MHHLPHELSVMILHHLPVDGHLNAMHRVSRLFHSTLDSIVLAQTHIRFQLDLQDANVIDNSANFDATVEDGAEKRMQARFAPLSVQWGSLPQSYRTALLALLFVHLPVLPRHQLSQGWFLDAFMAKDAAEAGKMANEWVSSMSLFHPRHEDAMRGAFFWCCFFGYTNALRTVLKSGFNDVHLHENRAIRLACYLGHVDVVSILLECGADPADANNSGIWFAAEHGHVEVVRMLLQDSRVDTEGLLGFACEQGFSTILPLLLTHPRINVSEEDHFSIKVACQNGHTDAVKMLLEHEPRTSVNPAAEDNFCIKLAAQNGHAEVIRLLLQDSRVDPAVEGSLPIAVAAEMGHAAVVRMLMRDSRVDVETEEHSPIILAAENGHDEVVELLLAEHYGVRPSSQDWAALVGALKLQQTSLFSWLISAIRLK